MVTNLIAVKSRLLGLIGIAALFNSCAPIPKSYSVISVPYISGRLVFAKNSHPLQGISVAFHEQETKTDSNGNFEFLLARNERSWCFIHGFPIDRPMPSDHITFNVDTLTLDSLGRFENKESFEFKTPSRDCYEIGAEPQGRISFELGKIKLFGFPSR